jgi:transcriptional regulator with XRE-family HTH domain
MNRLKAERLKRGWTQQTLAHYAQMQSSDISRIECGWAKPYPNQAARLAVVLGIPSDELLTIVGQRVPCDEAVARA